MLAASKVKLAIGAAGREASAIGRLLRGDDAVEPGADESKGERAGNDAERGRGDERRRAARRRKPARRLTRKNGKAGTSRRNSR